MGGYTQIVKDNKKLDDKCTFTVAAFDTEYDLLEDFTPIKDVKEELSVCPRGGTALLDAIGRTIVTVGEKLAAMKEDERPMKVCIIVQTDGQENASREYTKERVTELINQQQDTYNWQFQFIGADMNSVNEARSWGFSALNSTHYNTSNSNATFTTLGEKMMNMRSATTMDAYANAVSFTEDEIKVMNEGKTDSV